MTPYARTDVVTTTAANQTVPFKWPGNIRITNLQALSTTGGSVAVTAYSRNLTTYPYGISNVQVAPDGVNTQITLLSPFPVKLGDAVVFSGLTFTTAGASETPYTNIYRMIRKVDDYNFVIAAPYAGSTWTAGAVAQVVIPAIETPNYIAIPTQTGGAGTPVNVSLDIDYYNGDPISLASFGGITGYIYLQFATADSYVVTLTGRREIGLGL